MSDTVRVSNAGEITMPLIGVIKVAGISVEAAQNLIEQRLLRGGFRLAPQVNILVQEFATQGVSA